jgi:predicted transcriptional regulator
MTRFVPHALSRRERQIVDILFRQGRSTVAEVRAAIPDPPSYSAVRGLLRVLETKGHVRHEQEGPRFVYVPTAPRADAAKTAITQVVRTFLAGSVEEAVSALVSDSEAQLSSDELDRLAALIDKARKEGR